MEVLKSLRGPSSAVLADAQKYVRDTEYRARVDAADRELGTKLGPQLRSLAFPEQEPIPQKPAVAPPTEVELAASLKKYPTRKSVEDILNSKTDEASKLKKSDPTGYREMKIAGIFHGLSLALDSANTVKFAYQTPSDRRAKREAAAKAQQEPSGLENGLPPGITRNDKGELSLADAEAFNSWKSEQTAQKEARATIAAALEQQEITSTK